MKYVLIGLIRLYQWGISPYLMPRCRFQPTCSQYAIEAIQRFGFYKGSLLTIKRIGRCHPFGGSGFDPVPTCTHQHPDKSHGTTR